MRALDFSLNPLSGRKLLFALLLFLPCCFGHRLSPTRRGAFPFVRNASDFLAALWLTSGHTACAYFQSTFRKLLYPIPRNLQKVAVLIYTNGVPVMLHRGDRRRTRAHEGVKNCIAGIGEGQNAALCEFYWKLTRMNRFLGVIGLDVGNVPDGIVTKVFFS